MSYGCLLTKTSRWSAVSTRNPPPPTPPSALENNLRTSNRRLASTLATEDVSARTNASRESCSRDNALPCRHSDRIRILTRTAAAATIQNHHFGSRGRLAGTTQRGLRSSRGVKLGRPEHFFRHQQLLGREDEVVCDEEHRLAVWRSCFLDTHGHRLPNTRKTLSTHPAACHAPGRHPWDVNSRSGSRTDKLSSMFSVSECLCRASCATGLG